jgi:hypothetical protein
MTITSDDELYFRSLDIDDPNVPSVFTFTKSNILKDSITKLDMRARNEIFQKFKLQYNVEPTNDNNPTEEIVIGWDLEKSKPIYSGYPRVKENASGQLVEIDGMDNLPELCRLSIHINSAGLGSNEFGAASGDDKVFKLHFRPTTVSLATGQKIELDLPNIGGASQPKVAMQELTRMLVRFYTFDSWLFEISVSMRNVVYNAAVEGLANEAGTPERRIKLGDVITINEYFFTNNQDLRAFVMGMDLSKIYDGYVNLLCFAPKPPGQFGAAVDPNWDAGAPGPRNEADFLFKGDLYGLLSEDGTFADAGAPGLRDETEFRFPDGSYADPEGQGPGKV